MDSSATSHMTSDISNLQEVVPYSSFETVTSAGGEGLMIKHIGNTSLTTPFHNFHLKSVLHVPRLSLHLLSMYQLCKDNKCRSIVDELSLCIHDKATRQMLYHRLSNNDVYPLLDLKPSKFSPKVESPAVFLGQMVASISGIAS